MIYDFKNTIIGGPLFSVMLLSRLFARFGLIPKLIKGLKGRVFHIYSLLICQVFDLFKAGNKFVCGTV